MPNTFKYNLLPQSNTISANKFRIGVGDVEKGPTENTGFWNGITPPSGGYTLYEDKATQGPSIRVFGNDTSLINEVNKRSGNSYTAIYDALNWITLQTDLAVVNRDYEPIVTDNLKFLFDASIKPYSYNFKEGLIIGGVNNQWNDISGNGEQITYSDNTNQPSYVTNDGEGCLELNDKSFSMDFDNLSTNSVGVWVKLNTVSGSNKTQALYSYGTSSGRKGTLALISNTTDSNYKISFYTDSNTIAFSSDSDLVTPNTWHYITLTAYGYTAGIPPVLSFYTDFRLYLDGVLEETYTLNNSVNNSDRNASFKIGGSVVTLLNSTNDFKYSTVQYYSDVLTDDEVLQNYNAQKGRFGIT
jgi:hypothetical protein